MTAMHEPELQKTEPGDRTHGGGLLHLAAGISETLWQIIIFAISAAVILFSVYCLSHGITIIFMHLYYLPIVLLAYRYRYRGFVLSVILSLIYIGLVLWYSPGQNEVIIGALFRFVVFIGIAAVVAYLSEQFIQSEKSLKKVVDIQESSLMNANVWLMLLDIRGSILLWNNGAERISGYSAAEVTGSKDIWKSLYPDKEYRAVITKKIERIIAEDSFFENLETTIHTKSGAEKVISWNTRSFPVTSGQDARSIAIGIDITERKRAEEALLKNAEELHVAYEELTATDEELRQNLDEIGRSERALQESQKELELTLDATTDGIWKWDFSTNLLEFSPRYYLMLGYQPGEFPPTFESWLNLIHPDDRENALAATEAYLATKPDIYENELRLRTKSGESRWIHASARVVERDASGAALRMIGNHQDITERKVAEEALTENEAHLRTTLETLPVGVFIFARNGQILTANAMVNQIWGVRTGEVPLSQDMQEFIEYKGWWPDTGIAIKPEEWAASRVLLSGETAPVDIVNIQRFDGSMGTIIVSAVPFHDDGGEVTGAVAVIQDITGRRRAEEALQRVNQKLNVISQLTRKDLTNQVFVLSSYLELAKNQLAGQDQVIATLQKGVQTIRLIHDTIEYSKDYQDMGAKPPKWQNVKMELLLGVSHISIGKIQHSIETEDLEIFADPLLEKVCQRLFENSLVHGDHVTRVRVWHTATPDWASIFFEDDGIGISAEKKEQIFLRDESTGRATTRSLIFVREILDITGITIKETGEPGKGARFEITVPKGAWRIAGKGD
jgi:PAS domain S-box-containing protein